MKTTESAGKAGESISRFELIPPSIPAFLDEAPVPSEEKCDGRLHEDVFCGECGDRQEGDG